MNIVIAGAGKVGMELVRQLSKSNRIVVIDRERALVENLINVYDVIGFCGSATDCRLQKEAQVDKADLLIATTSDDEINILSCLIAKKLGVKNTIARIRDPENEQMLSFMDEELGLSMSINPEKSAAQAIARVLCFPAAMKIETFSGGRLELIEYRIPSSSLLDGLALRSLSETVRARLLVCGVTRKGETAIPLGNYTLQAGDTIYFTAAPREAARFFRALGVFREKASYVMIAGVGKMCFYLVSELLGLGMKVKVVDPDEQRCEEICAEFPKISAAVGRGEDTDFLLEEGIEKADGFVAITASDEANVLMCLSVADRYPECKVTAKINRQSTVDFVTRSNLIDSIISTSAFTSETILQYVRAMQDAASGTVKSLHRLANDKIEALEFHISYEAEFIGRPLSETRFIPGVLIAGIVRKNDIIIPCGSDSIQLDDDVIVITSASDITDIRDIFAKQGSEK